MVLPLSVFLSEFHLEKSNAKKAKATKYTEGKTDYYLCAENTGKPLLRVSYMNIEVNNLLSLILLTLYMRRPVR